MSRTCLLLAPVAFTAAAGQPNLPAQLTLLQWASLEVQTSAGNVRLSRQEVDFTRERFTQGISDNTEVENAQDRLKRADDAQIRAQYALGLAQANLARATRGGKETRIHHAD